MHSFADRRALRWGFVFLSFLTTLTFIARPESLGAQENPGADAALEWNSALLHSVAASGTVPPQAAWNLALLHTAGFEALRVTNGSEIAFHGAAFEILSKLYPQQTARMDLNLAIPSFRAQGFSLSDHDFKKGRAIAASLWEQRRWEHHYQAREWLPTGTPGEWKKTPPAFDPPLLPAWGEMPTWGSREPLDTLMRDLVPPAFGTTRYRRELMQVLALGGKSSNLRTEDQTRIASFWAGGRGTVTPPGQWNQIAALLIATSGSDLRKAALLFRDLNQALADAAVAAWRLKYRQVTCRPVTVALEGMGPMKPVPGWEPLLVTPPFPEYVSGHSTFSQAAATILALHLPETALKPFTYSNTGDPKDARQLRDVFAAANEAGMSRIFGGIHFQAGNRDGQRLGRRVACRQMREKMAASRTHSRLCRE